MTTAPKVVKEMIASLDEIEDTIDELYAHVGYYREQIEDKLYEISKRKAEDLEL